MKTIKLSNEQATELFLRNPEFRTTILSDFSDSDLGIAILRPKSWSELKSIKGYYVTNSSGILEVDNPLEYKGGFENTVPTKADAKSILALSQLLQLANNLNGNEDIDWKDSHTTKFSVYYNHRDAELRTTWANSHQSDILLFRREEEAEFSAKYHKDLWLDYYGVAK